MSNERDQLLKALRESLALSVQIRFEQVVIDRLTTMVQEDPEAAVWIEGWRGRGDECA